MKNSERHSPQKHDEDILYDLLRPRQRPKQMPDLTVERSLPETTF
jgi:hypothetical protein